MGYLDLLPDDSRERISKTVNEAKLKREKEKIKKKKRIAKQYTYYEKL
jgi:hypothetical protein